MHWVVQNNLFNEHNFTTLVEVLDRGQIPYSLVKIIPFVHEIEPDISPDNPVYVVGATSLCHVAKKKGWLPGAFLNENFTYQVWSKHYDVLNPDSLVCTFREAKDKVTETVFIRPADDGKPFAGALISPESFVEWYENVTRYKNDDLERFLGSTVVLSSPKHIQREYRLFVVDGRIVTSSMYKLGDQVRYKCGADEEILSFAQQQIDKWQPAKAFVIDIAMTDNGPKVVEINNINSAGFYDIDISKLVQAIEGLHDTH